MSLFGASVFNVYIIQERCSLVPAKLIINLRPQELEGIMKTNFHGPMNITRSLLPRLRAKGSGTLFYVSSQAGWHADPGASGYCASKFALEGMLCTHDPVSACISGHQMLRILLPRCSRVSLA